MSRNAFRASVISLIFLFFASIDAAFAQQQVVHYSPSGNVNEANFPSYIGNRTGDCCWAHDAGRSEWG